MGNNNKELSDIFVASTNDLRLMENVGEKKDESRKKPNKGKEDNESNIESTKKPNMMKNGLKDRPFLSWIRILLVTAIWWSFVTGFFCLSFFLMNEILYGSNNSAQPYFARTFMKYPGILNQPSLNIMCLKSTVNNTKESCDTAELSVRVNKIFNFVPLPYSKDKLPKELVEKLASLGVTEEKMLQEKKKMVYVTCEGRKQEDKVSLEGMIIKTKFPGETSGIKVTEFPWNTETDKNSWPQVSFDLSKTKVIRDMTKQKVVMTCKAWAKNIEREDRSVDKKTPRGGVLAVFCFNNGRIVKAVDCD